MANRFAMVGAAAQCYRGVWSHYQVDDDGCLAGCRVIGPITSTALRPPRTRSSSPSSTAHSLRRPYKDVDASASR